MCQALILRVLSSQFHFSEPLNPWTSRDAYFEGRYTIHCSTGSLFVCVFFFFGFFCSFFIPSRFLLLLFSPYIEILTHKSIHLYICHKHEPAPGEPGEVIARSVRVPIDGYKFGDHWRALTIRIPPDASNAKMGSPCPSLKVILRDNLYYTYL